MRIVRLCEGMACVRAGLKHLGLAVRHRTLYRKPLNAIAETYRLYSATPVVAQKKGKKGGSSQQGSEIPEEKFDLSRQIPVNLYKDGEEPEYKADSEYPAWLWNINKDKRTVEEVVREGVEHLTPREQRNVFKRLRRDQVKKRNTENKKR
eukprot:gb/GECG01004290.1/.p1 GENE.gb/GECG01004290.1/~~gb/GECG01004290.1/.p1  ORF type:complete len:150 (+),score=16.75 gb/GECG01004290.1/:1-450(+)